MCSRERWRNSQATRNRSLRRPKTDSTSLASLFRTLCLSLETELRVVHTAAESIHTGDQEETRRRFRRLASRRNKIPNSPSSPNSSPLKSRRSIFGRKKRPDTSETATPTLGTFGEDVQDLSELGCEQRAELERNVTRQHAIFEAQESARRQEKQDAEERTKKEQEDKKKGKKVKAKERRVVWVNVEGAKTNPKAYERNKVRTSKYTLLSFLPKVSLLPHSLEENARYSCSDPISRRT